MMKRLIKMGVLELFIVLIPGLLFALPAPFDTIRITDDFGPRLLSGNYDFHEGIDYSPRPGDADTGWMIRAVEGGLITQISTSSGRKHIKVKVPKPGGAPVDSAHFAYVHIFKDGNPPMSVRRILHSQAGHRPFQ